MRLCSLQRRALLRGSHGGADGNLDHTADGLPHDQRDAEVDHAVCNCAHTDHQEDGEREALVVKAAVQHAAKIEQCDDERLTNGVNNCQNRVEQHGRRGPQKNIGVLFQNQAADCHKAEVAQRAQRDHRRQACKEEAHTGAERNRHRYRGRNEHRDKNRHVTRQRKRHGLQYDFRRKHGDHNTHRAKQRRDHHRQNFLIRLFHFNHLKSFYRVALSKSVCLPPRIATFITVDYTCVLTVF